MRQKSLSLRQDCQILVFLSLSICLFVSVSLCVWEIERDGRGEESGDKVAQKERKWCKMSGRESCGGETRGVVGSHRWSSRRRPSFSGSCGRGGGWVWLKRRANTQHVNLVPSAGRTTLNIQLCKLRRCNRATACPQLNFQNLLATPTRHQLVWVTAAEEKILKYWTCIILRLFPSITVNQRWCLAA